MTQMAGDPGHDLLIGLGPWTHARGVLGGDVPTGARLHDGRTGVVEDDLILGLADGLTFGCLAEGAAQKVSKLGKLAATGTETDKLFQDEITTKLVAALKRPALDAVPSMKV